jgi:periplasmic protein TonB
MERPSHIFFTRHSPFSRAPMVGLAIGLQFVGFWLFTQGLREHRIDFGPGVIHVDPIEQKASPRTPPPPLPPDTHIEIVQAPLPLFDYSTPRDPGTSLTTANLTPSTKPRTESVGVDHAAIGITATHTVPPYPVVERRLGIEGTVTLQLTVGTEGQVTAAEVVKSAGREALDQAARDWIIGHWRYRPALKDGNPAVVQVLANVTYSLKNQP